MCCPMLHYGHCQHNSCHESSLLAAKFFKSLAESQIAPLRHNNLLCFVDGQRRTYALQAGGTMKTDDFVETFFAARLGEDFPTAAQAAESKLCWYSNATTLPHAVTICEQQLRFGRHKFTLPTWFHSFAFFEALAADASVPLHELGVQVIEWSWGGQGLSAVTVLNDFQKLTWPTTAPQPSKRKGGKAEASSWDPTSAFLRSIGMRVRPQGRDSIVSVPRSKQKLAEACCNDASSDSGSGSSTEFEDKFAKARLHSDSDQEDPPHCRKKMVRAAQVCRGW